MKKLQFDYKTVLAVVCMFVVTGAIFADLFLCRDTADIPFYFPFETSNRLEAYSVSKTIIYVFIQRLKQFVILYLMFKVLRPHIMMRGIVFGLSFLLGIMCSCQFYQMGILGVVWLILCLFPHYILYLWGIGAMYRLRLTKETENNRYVYGILIIAFMVTGVLSEGIISKFFLKKFLQYMGM